uniref:Uncharacterized protein n=1 Tax=Oryza sativa subsp. japonica TaxID=39947 RepID=Q652X6_ORYSJ|nr:hypothetical protein [Oryza sativa Japonica Group]
MHRVALPLVRTAARRPSLAWIHADPAVVAVSGADDGRGGGGRVRRRRDDGGQERRRVIPGLGRYNFTALDNRLSRAVHLNRSHGKKNFLCGARTWKY